MFDPNVARSSGVENTLGSPVRQNSSIFGLVDWCTPTNPVSLTRFREPFSRSCPQIEQNRVVAPSLWAQALFTL